jgi:hypothetical protein
MAVVFPFADQLESMATMSDQKSYLVRRVINWRYAFPKPREAGQTEFLSPAFAIAMDDSILQRHHGRPSVCKNSQRYFEIYVFRSRD